MTITTRQTTAAGVTNKNATLTNAELDANFVDIAAKLATVSGTNTGDNATNSQYSADYRAGNFVAGTHYIAPGGALGTPSSGNLSSCTADGTNAPGFRGIPLVSASANTTLTKAHAGGGLKHPSADTTARTFTIDSNANQSWDDGTALTFLNQNAAGVVTIALTTDTMRLAGAGTTGSRTLAANGMATAIWDAATTTWYINGSGLT